MLNCLSAQIDNWLANQMAATCEINCEITSQFLKVNAPKQIQQTEGVSTLSNLSKDSKISQTAFHFFQNFTDWILSFGRSFIFRLEDACIIFIESPLHLTAAMCSFGVYRDEENRFLLTFFCRQPKLPFEPNNAFLVRCHTEDFRHLARVESLSRSTCTANAEGREHSDVGDGRTKAIVFSGQICGGLQQKMLSSRAVRFIMCEAFDSDSGGPPGGGVWYGVLKTLSY